AGLGGIGYLVSRSVNARQSRTLRDLGEEIIPQVAQRIQNFRRVKVKNGRTVWEITAADAQYFEQNDEIVVREPRMRLFVADGKREARVEGHEGHLRLNGREVNAITLHGDVTVHIDDLEVVTEEATYDHERDLITSNVAVTVRDKSMEVHGRGMEVEVGPQ